MIEYIGLNFEKLTHQYGYAFLSDVVLDDNIPDQMKIELIDALTFEFKLRLQKKLLGEYLGELEFDPKK